MLSRRTARRHSSFVHDRQACRPTPGSHDHFEPVDWEHDVDVRAIGRSEAWKGWLPAGRVTLLRGPTGVGKTVLAQQIATMVALGRPLWGYPTERHRVLALFTTDDEIDLRRRQAAICHWAGCRPADLARRLFAEGRAGRPNVLATFDPRGELEPGEAADMFRRACTDVDPGLIVVDDLDHVFAGDPEQRSHVAQFVGFLTGIARDLDAAVLLVGTFEKYEGVAWDTVVRERLVLARGDGPDRLQLTRTATARAPEATLELCVRSGILDVPEGERPTLPIGSREGDRSTSARQVVLSGLEELRRRGIVASPLPRARTYGPSLLVRSGLSGGFDREALTRAIEDLLAEGILRPDVCLFRRRNGQWRRGLGRPEWDQVAAGRRRSATSNL